MRLTARKPGVGRNIPKKRATRVRLQQGKKDPRSNFYGLNGFPRIAILGNIDT